MGLDTGVCCGVCGAGGPVRASRLASRADTWPAAAHHEVAEAGPPPPLRLMRYRGTRRSTVVGTAEQVTRRGARVEVQQAIYGIPPPTGESRLE